jgi:hypothetical protein
MAKGRQNTLRAFVFRIVVLIIPNIFCLVHAVRNSEVATIGIWAFAIVAFESALMAKVCTLSASPRQREDHLELRKICQWM